MKKKNKEKSKEQKKVIIAGHSLNDAGGLSFISASLIKKYLEMNYEIGYINISPLNMDVNGFVKFGIETTKCHIINCNVYDKQHINTFDKFYKSFKSDLVISIHDPWLLDHITYSSYRNSFFWVAYQTFETEKYPEKVNAPTAVYPFTEVPKSLVEIFQSCDLVIPCSEHGIKALKNFDIEQDEYIYMGIDIIEKIVVNKLKNKSRVEVFGHSVKETDFLFFTIGVNNQRKKLDRTLMAFAKFLETKNYDTKYKLYLHCDIKRKLSGTDILELIKSLKIEKNVLIENKEISKNVLYERLALCDCYISLHGAEGFGLPFVEAMMFDKPCIATDYSTPSEFCNRELLVNFSEIYYASNFCLPLALACLTDAVSVMNKVVSGYSNNDYGYDYVKKNFDLKNNINRLVDIIDSIYIDWKSDTNKIKLPIKRII